MKTTRYLTKFNGDKPHLVEVTDHTAKIYKRDSPPVLIEVYEFIKIFIGKSLVTPLTIRSGNHGRLYSANTILLQIPSNNQNYKYIFIGNEIKYFETTSIIKTYMSPVGNASVPYPHAIDKNGIYYLILENVSINIDIEELIDEDPYVYFYAHCQVGECIYRNKIVKPIEYFENIKKVFVDNKQIDLYFNSNIENYYDELLKNHSGSILSFEFTNNTKINVSKEYFIRLMTKLGNKLKCNEMLNVSIIK
jgi:hypothetical protein